MEAQPAVETTPAFPALSGMMLASPRGFCAGVERAIEIVEQSLDLFSPPIYVRHEIVHNRYVVDGLRDKGAIFVEDLDEVPDGATVIFSAHGVAKEVVTRATDRGLQILDATCPLVTKVHLEVRRHHKDGRDVVLIGHAGHPEVIGTIGQVSGGMHLVSTAEDVTALDVSNPGQIAFVTQTTLSVDDTATVVNALRTRFPHIIGPAKQDICYATQNRQDAVKRMAETVDLVLVLGAPNSSNSNRLREVAEVHGCPAYLIERAVELDPTWFTPGMRVGITAGASAPEVLVTEVVDALKADTDCTVGVLDGPVERVDFGLPDALRR